MKILIVVCFAVVASCKALSMGPRMMTNALTCANDNNVDLTKFSMTKGQQLPDPKLFENHDYKCFAKCMALKLGLISANGDLIPDKIKSVFQATDQDLERAKKCADENKQTDVCERVFAIHDCFAAKPE